MCHTCKVSVLVAVASQFEPYHMLQCRALVVFLECSSLKIDGRIHKKDFLRTKPFELGSEEGCVQIQTIQMQSTCVFKIVNSPSHSLNNCDVQTPTVQFKD